MSTATRIELEAPIKRSNIVALTGPLCTERYDPSDNENYFALNNRLIARFVFVEIFGYVSN